MTTITSEATIDMMEPMFVSNGYPRTITLDNRRQFVISTFEEYCTKRNIRLNFTAKLSVKIGHC